MSTTRIFWNLIYWVDSQSNPRRTTVEATDRPLTVSEASTFIESGAVYKIEFGFIERP